MCMRAAHTFKGELWDIKSHIFGIVPGIKSTPFKEIIWIPQSRHVHGPPVGDP